MYQYKVLTQKDGMLGGKFNPEALEKALNNLAAEGWRVEGTTTTTFPGMMSSREELVIILGKPS